MISLGKETNTVRNFRCKNRTASAKAIDIIAETFETYAKGGTALRATPIMRLSAPVDVIKPMVVQGQEEGSSC